MSHFARLFDIDDTQIVALIQPRDEGGYELRLFMEIYSAVVQVAYGFAPLNADSEVDDEQAEALATSALKNLTLEDAVRIRNNLMECGL